MLWWPLGFFMMVFTLHQLFNSSPTLIFQTWARSSLHFLGLENLSNFNSSQDFHLYFWTDDAVELHLKRTKIWSFAFLGKCLELPYVLIFYLRRILTYLLPRTFEIRVFQHPRNIHKNCHASCSPQKMRCNKIEILKPNSARASSTFLEFGNVHEIRYFINFLLSCFFGLPWFSIFGHEFRFFPRW